VSNIKFLEIKSHHFSTLIDVNAVTPALFCLF